VVVVADVDGLRELCVTRASAFPARHLPKSSLPASSAAARGVPLSLVFAGGPAWRATRTALSPLFSPPALAAAQPLIRASAAELASVALAAAEANPSAEVDVLALLSNYTLDVVSGGVLGAHAHAQKAAAAGGGAAPLAASTAALFESLEPVTGDGRLNDPWAALAELTPTVLAPVWRAAACIAPARAVCRLQAADDAVRSTAREILADTRTRLKQDIDAAPATVCSLLAGPAGAAAALRHGSAPMSDESIVAQAHTMLVAGIETTASATAHAIYLLARHPEAAARVRAEADAGGPPVYAQAALREGMRLLPAVSMLNRVAASDDARLRGHVIPRGTFVVGCLTPVLRDAALYPEPEAYRPERFMPGADDAEAMRELSPQLAWPVFGAGPRACIGARLALAEGGQALQALFASADVALPPGAPPLRIREGITNAPAGGLRVRLTRRELSKTKS
jgi:thromboxane-A synthase/cytochrome P450 family 3 subfamily A